VSSLVLPFQRRRLEKKATHAAWRKVAPIPYLHDGWDGGGLRSVVDPEDGMAAAQYKSLSSGSRAGSQRNADGVVVA